MAAFTVINWGNIPNGEGTIDWNHIKKENTDRRDHVWLFFFGVLDNESSGLTLSIKDLAKKVATLSFAQMQKLNGNTRTEEDENEYIAYVLLHNGATELLSGGQGLEQYLITWFMQQEDSITKVDDFLFSVKPEALMSMGYDEVASIKGELKSSPTTAVTNSTWDKITENTFKDYYSVRDFQERTEKWVNDSLDTSNISLVIDLLLSAIENGVRQQDLVNKILSYPSVQRFQFNTVKEFTTQLQAAAENYYDSLKLVVDVKMWGSTGKILGNELELRQLAETKAKICALLQSN